MAYFDESIQTTKKDGEDWPHTCSLEDFEVVWFAVHKSIERRIVSETVTVQSQQSSKTETTYDDPNKNNSTADAMRVETNSYGK